MNLIVEKSEISQNPAYFLRRAGYGYIQPRHSESGSFVRHFGRALYPRLHLYVQDEGDSFVFSLHLDQKQPSYQGSYAHNAEYEGPFVEEEMRRLRDLLGTGVINNKRSKTA